MRKTNENPSFYLFCLLTHFSSIFYLFYVYFVSVYILLTMLAVLAGSNMWAQTFSYTESNKTLTIGVTEDLSNDNDAAGKVQTEVTKCKPETVIVNGGGKINSDFIKAILYRIDDKITITTLTLALLL